MAEKSFDTLLRQALLEANWREYQFLWEDPEDPDLSPRYLRWRARLMADPFAWMKKQLRPLWAKALRAVACLLLASALTLGSLMAVSPTVRAAVLNWLREISRDQVTYTSTDAQDHDEPPTWYPTWLPDGWSLEEAEGRTSRADYRFAGGEGRMTFWCGYPDGGSFGFSSGEEMTQSGRQVTVQGYPADLYEKGGQMYLIWENEDGILFWFSATNVSEEDLLKTAESVEPVEGELPEYRMTWAPEGYTEFDRSVLPAAVQETWMGPDTSLTLLYSAEPLKVPDGTWETLSVNGVKAQYWAAEPRESGSDTLVNGQESDGSSVEVGGITITTGTIVGPNSARVNTLAWTDPDTGLFFRLHGTVDRDTLIRMAESIAAAETPSSALAAGETAGD